MKKNGKPAILVVDDEKHFREELKRSLAEQGYQVTAVENGYQAIEEVRKQGFDVVILDLVMPGLDGFETYDSLHKIARTIQGIMLTGNVSVETVAQSATKRIRDYIPKSSIDQLLDAIKKVLKEEPVPRDPSGKVLTQPAQITETGEYLYSQHAKDEAAKFWEEAARVYKSMQRWELAAVNFQKAAKIWERKGQEESLKLALDCLREATQMFKRIGQHEKADSLEKRTGELRGKLKRGEKHGM